jgi:SAM-dependent methyltransferase
VAYVGVEKTDALRQIAGERVAALKNPNVSVAPGDIRDAGFAQGRTFDIVLCQRVIINLLDANDQKAALRNIVAAVKPGGAVLFIEAFESGLHKLNIARAEFELPAIPTADHNLYLADDFFSIPELTPYESEGWRIPENALSTHYYVSRVLHPAILGARPFIRNSEFAKFLSAALPMGIGDYSQLRICAFRKRG